MPHPGLVGGFRVLPRRGELTGVWLISARRIYFASENAFFAEKRGAKKSVKYVFHIERAKIGTEALCFRCHLAPREFGGL
jgi:hypothetical protein